MEREPTRYAAARSKGWLFLGIAALVCFGLAAAILLGVVAGGRGYGAVAVFPAALVTILGLCSLVLAGWSTTVRYEVSPERISLFCGSVRYNIPIAEITGVTKTDLGMTMWSSTRFPGFALGSIPYEEVGNVIMCSTRSLKGIILVTTSKKKYGLTPANETAFLAELEGYLEAR